MWNTLTAQWGDAARDREGGREICEEAIQRLKLFGLAQVEWAGKYEATVVLSDSVKSLKVGDFLNF